MDYTGDYDSAGRSPSLGKCANSGTVLPFSQLADYNDGSLWSNHSKDAVPWVVRSQAIQKIYDRTFCSDIDCLRFQPNIDAGYDTRPAAPNISGRCSFGEPTQPEWEQYLRKVKAKLESPGARLGFPLSGGGVQPAVTIYAWNEFAEGGIVAPTQGEGWSKLLGIAAVFGG